MGVEVWFWRPSSFWWPCRPPSFSWAASLWEAWAGGVRVFWIVNEKRQERQQNGIDNFLVAPSRVVACIAFCVPSFSRVHSLSVSGRRPKFRCPFHAHSSETSMSVPTGGPRPPFLPFPPSPERCAHGALPAILRRFLKIKRKPNLPPTDRNLEGRQDKVFISKVRQ